MNEKMTANEQCKYLIVLLGLNGAIRHAKEELGNSGLMPESAYWQDVLGVLLKKRNPQPHE